MDSLQAKKLLDNMPDETGVYQFYSEDNELIYVGKAISLRKRVTSYFKAKHDSRKTTELVLKIHHVEWTVCPSAHDALLLENNLIKRLQPRYNINLKDDKTYPYVVITDDPFPRIYMTRRKKILAKGEHYGPYTSVTLIRQLLQIIRDTIPLRTCTLNLSERAIARGRYRPCMEYHIKKCKAPCAALQTAEDYENDLAKARALLKGNFKSLVRSYKKQMKEKAAALLFEEAQYYKNHIEAIEKLHSHSIFAMSLKEDADICCFVESDNTLWVHFSLLRQGTILQSKVSHYKLNTQRPSEELLSTILFDMRTIFRSDTSSILSNRPVNFGKDNFTVHIPMRGKKKQLVEWAMQNLRSHIESKCLAEQKQAKQYELLERVKSKLYLPKLPLRIESFDNSHLQGSAQVAAMVCFLNGYASKKEYRTFHLKEATKGDDYGSMREVIYRRYLRKINENKPLPQLVIIDGGKGQLSAAMESLRRLSLDGIISVISIAKKEEQLFFPNDRDSLKLNMDDPVLRFIRRIRDETHRFAIAFHRKCQAKKSMQAASKS